MAQKVLKLAVTQKSDELGIVWGYASVADAVDLQGDIVPQAGLVSAVYEFMEAYYSEQAAIGENHKKPADAVLVESTFHYLAGHLRWWVGVKLLSAELREAARKGEISGFSIGGTYEEAEEV
ncbi:MAG: XkdF-like putative serine protease domain-containing protein [Bryobacteraceae bacterium]